MREYSKTQKQSRINVTVAVFLKIMKIKLKPITCIVLNFQQYFLPSLHFQTSKLILYTIFFFRFLKMLKFN